MSKKKAFLLRIPPKLYEVLQRWADDELRSLNGQIEYILRESLREAGRLKRESSQDEEDSKTDGS